MSQIRLHAQLHTAPLAARLQGQVCRALHLKLEVKPEVLMGASGVAGGGR